MDEIPGPVDNRVLSSNGYIGELDYQRTREPDRLIEFLTGTRWWKHFCNFVATLSSINFFIFSFLLDHRQVYVGVHIPLRPRKHHHQRHHHRRRRRPNGSIEFKSDDSGKWASWLSIPTLSIRLRLFKQTVFILGDHFNSFVVYKTVSMRREKTEATHKKCSSLL